MLETSVKNFTIGAWLKNVVMGMKHLNKWNRGANVSDVEAIRNFTDFFSYLIPGKFKCFQNKDFQGIINWVSQK